MILSSSRSTTVRLMILRERLEAFVQHDERINLIAKSNRGIVAALNEGIEMARGEYIARIDADDLCNNDRLAIQVSVMDRNPQLVALGSNLDAIIDQTAQSDAVHFRCRFPMRRSMLSILRADRASTTQALCCAQTNSDVSVALSSEGFCPAEDLDLWIRLAEVGEVADLAEPLLIRRLTLDGDCRPARWREQESIIRRVLIDAWERRDLAGEPVFPRVPPFSRAARYRQWSWFAVQDHQLPLANEYAKRALIQEPQTWRSWYTLSRSLFVSVRTALAGHMTAPHT